MSEQPTRKPTTAQAKAINAALNYAERNPGNAADFIATGTRRDVAAALVRNGWAALPEYAADTGAWKLALVTPAGAAAVGRTLPDPEAQAEAAKDAIIEARGRWWTRAVFAGVHSGLTFRQARSAAMGSARG